MAVPSPANAVARVQDSNPHLVASGVTAAAVASGTVIATLPAVSSPGNYLVHASSQPGGSGTIANTDGGNVLLQKNGATVAVVPQISSAAVPPTPLDINLSLAAGDVLTLKTGASAAPASVYYAFVLTAQQVA